jgi:hypothetical protein
MMKRNTKILIRIMAVMLVAVVALGAYLSSKSYVNISYPVTINCNKQTGCSSTDIQTCNTQLKSFLSTNSGSGWICSNDCSVKCSESNEMKVLDSGYSNHCDVYSGGGALVEAYAKCQQTIAQPHAKTVCSDGSKTVFSSGISATQKDFVGWDVYYANEFDKLEEKIQDCPYGCKMSSSTSAVCYTASSYNKCQDKVCYAVSNKWNVMCKDSDGEFTSIVNSCPAGCTNGVCIIPTVVSNNTVTNQKPSCSFAACDSDITTACSDSSIITSYKCENGCAVGTNEVCTNADGTTPANPTTSTCKYYESQNADGSCSFSFSEATSNNGISQLWNDQKYIIMVVIAAFVMLIVFIVTKKR